MIQGRRRFLRITVFFLLFVLLFFLSRFMVRDHSPGITPPPASSGAGGEGSLPATADSAGQNPALAEAKPVSRVKTPVAVRAGSTAAVSGNTTAVSDAMAAESTVTRDITPPYVHAEPGPGLHPAPVRVKLLSDEPAAISFRTDRDTAWKPYREPVPVRDSLTLFFKGADSAGNVSDEVERRYVIARPANAKCPQNMVPVEAGGMRFCIDRYEWPNKKGVMPAGYLNWYMAYDSCRTYKKRLCSADEWEAACGGKAGALYPYGDEYESRACNTESGGPLASGALEECRSFFGAYDLSGNLREWTSTKAARNDRHYQVYGGYWENRGQSQCNSTQYSFFPENKFVTIGFRCCRDGE